MNPDALIVAVAVTHPPEWLWGMTPEAWLTLAGLFFGPIIALAIQRHLDNRREKHAKELWVFRELLVTRGSRLSQRHVDALNSISLEFYGERKVIEAWDKYFDSFVLANPKPENDAEIRAWLEKGDDLLAALLYQIAEAVGYHFGEVDLKRKFYIPIAHGQAENEANVIRKGFFDVFNGARKFPIDVDLAQEFKDFIQQQSGKTTAAPVSSPQVPIATKPPATS